jgi:hypothetical protein
MKKNNVHFYFWLTAVFASIASIISYVYYLNLGVTVAYNDARAHLDMARLVVDNLKPGIAQMGSVWLPLNHILMLPLVWNYTLWQSGFAGSLISMATFIGSALFIFLLVNELTKKPPIAFLGSLVFILNPNVLYMQTTPMTELTLLFFFTGTSYFLCKWVKENFNIIYLILSAFMVFGATLTRYDGWFLFICLIPLIAVMTFVSAISRKTDVKKAILVHTARVIEGRIVIFSTIGGYGIVLWLVWNQIIYGQALYFMIGPYSAYAQQTKIKEAGSLLTFHNLPLSIQSYWWAMIDNTGSLLLLLGIIGFLYFLIKQKISPIALALYTLLTPLLFHIVSLYAGNSILVVPQLGAYATQEAHTSWFNVRYGLMMVPAVAIFSAYLASRARIIAVILLVSIVAQAGLLYLRNDVITLTDGVIGTSSLDVGDASNWLKKEVASKKGNVLTSIAYNNALAFSTGMPLKRFIHEGTGNYWSDSLTMPSKHAEWIIMANGDVGDAIYTSLVTKQNPDFKNNFTLVMKGKHTNIYQRNESLIAKNTVLGANTKNLNIHGMNSYDLAYRTHKEIDETLSLAEANSINTIRFWGFGEGFKDSFQPSLGEYNYKMFDNLSYVVNSAEERNIKVIITLSNYWKDYGGIIQYLKWYDLPSNSAVQKDEFFKNQKITTSFEKYINELLNHKSLYTGKKLKEEKAIFGWELMNEPRSSTVEMQEVVLKWMEQTSAYLKQIDSDHPILAGIEGFTDQYQPDGHGPLLEDVAKLKNIEILTGHYYIRENDKSTIAEVFSYWQQVQNRTGKPLLIEEAGFVKDRKINDNKERIDLYKDIYSEAKSRGLNGVLLWNWALAVDSSFGISPKDKGDSDILDLIKAQGAK